MLLNNYRQNDERPRRPRVNRPPRDEPIQPNENSQISGPQQGGEENRGGFRGGFRGGRGGRGGYRGGARGGGFSGKREYERHSGSDKTLVVDC